MKTYSPKASQITRKWYWLIADEAPLGRLATKAAQLLMGKHKPGFARHIDCGDFVVITNSDQLVVSGQKIDQKIYYRHSGYPGGLKSRTLKEVMAHDSTQAVIHAVRGMLPDNKLRGPRLIRLKVYAGDEHQHEAQRPEKISLKGDNK